MTVEPLLWDTSIQGTLPFKGKKNLVQTFKKIFVFVTSIEETPLFRGNGTLLLGPDKVFTSHDSDSFLKNELPVSHLKIGELHLHVGI